MKQRTPPSVSAGRLIYSFLFFLLLFALPSVTTAQKKPVSAKPTNAKPKAKATKTPAKAPDELTRLRAEFIKATDEYKASLEQLRGSYEKNVARAEAKAIQSKELFAEGLISKNDLEASERAVTVAKDRVSEVDRRTAAADSQIAETLLEAEAGAKLARSRPLARGGMVQTAAMIRYNGGAVWALSDAWKVQQFFLGAFKKQLPVAVFGQGSIHDRWRLDHHNAMDVSLHPDGPEGQALLGFLRANGIPFLAFRQAIPGTATGPHIHIGRPSHRY